MSLSFFSFSFWIEQFKWLKCIKHPSEVKNLCAVYQMISLLISVLQYFLWWHQCVCFSVFYLQNIEGKYNSSIETLLSIVTIWLMILLTLSKLNYWLTYRDVLSWRFHSWSIEFQIWSKRHTKSPSGFFFFSFFFGHTMWLMRS